jgi:hypothetical protein
VTITPVGSDTATESGAATGPVSDYWSYSASPLGEGVYTVEWDGGDDATDTEVIEVTGGRLFLVSELRSADADVTVAAYPSLKVMQTRTDVEDEFECITGRSFVPVTRRVRVDVDTDRDAIWLGRFDMLTLVSFVDSDDTDCAEDVDLDDNGVLSGLSSLTAGRYVATVRYGLTYVPGDVKRAAMLRARTLLFSATSGIPDRATSFSVAEGGTYTLATAGVGRWKTGIPDVDAVLERYTYDIALSVLGNVA